MIRLLIERDLALAFRRGGGALASLSFFAMVFALFAFGLGPEALKANAPRVLVVSALLSCLISLPGLFERDAEDGTLEQYLLQPGALEWMVAGKLLAYWVGNALPLAALSPLLGLMAGVETAQLTLLLGALLLATPILCAIGAFGAALTLGARKGGIAQALILLPLYMPVLIFAGAAAGGEGQGTFLLLGGMLLFMLPVFCWLAAALLRLQE